MTGARTQVNYDVDAAFQGLDAGPGSDEEEPESDFETPESPASSSDDEADGAVAIVHEDAIASIAAGSNADLVAGFTAADRATFLKVRVDAFPQSAALLCQIS